MSNGLLGHFGIIDWFYSLSKDEHEKIFRYYKNFTTDPDDLINGEVYYTSNTGAKLLCSLAYNAFHYKDHVLSSVLLQKAYELIKDKEDYDYCLAIGKKISEERGYTPDQKDIDEYKQKILLKIQENQGILQSEIKKLFSDREEVFVGYALSQLKYDGKIRREKKGRSFQLYTT